MATPRSALTPLWLLRAAWVAMPFLAGPALADALADRARSVQIAVSVAAWAVWAVAVLAVAVPRTATLTVVRICVPGGVAVAAWAALGAPRPGWAAIGIATALVAAGAAMAPSVADAFVDGSSYGAERRMALRAPASLLVAGTLAWIVLAAAVVAPVLALGTERWVLGAVTAVVGTAIAALVAVRLHQLSRRWLVLVPAGLVVHDPLVLAEPVLLQRHLLDHIGPAPADADERSVDLTGGALGLALEATMREPFSLGRRSGRDTVEVADVSSVLVTPGRPAAVLDAARSHRLPVA